MTFGVIDCPDCGKEVSARAIVCIHCGGPMLQGTRQQRLSDLSGQPPKATSVGDMSAHATASDPVAGSVSSPPPRPAAKRPSTSSTPEPEPETNQERRVSLTERLIAFILSPIGIGLLLMFFLGMRSGRKQ